VNKKRILQITLPLAIVAVIAGIWLAKNQGSKPPASGLGTPLQIVSVDLAEIQSHGLPVIIDFGSDDCIPCKQMTPVLQKLNVEMQGRAVIHFVDVWKYPDAAQDFPIQVIPTQVFYTADGKPYVPSENLDIPFTMYTHKDTKEHLFTVHEGGLTEQEMWSILTDMGL
jgi:thioredoxin 1